MGASFDVSGRNDELPTSSSVFILEISHAPTDDIGCRGLDCYRARSVVVLRMARGDCEMFGRSV